MIAFVLFASSVGQHSDAFQEFVLGRISSIPCGVIVDRVDEVSRTQYLIADFRCEHEDILRVAVGFRSQGVSVGLGHHRSVGVMVSREGRVKIPLGCLFWSAHTKNRPQEIEEHPLDAYWDVAGGASGLVYVQHETSCNQSQTDLHHGGHEEFTNQRGDVGRGRGVFGDHEHEHSHGQQRCDHKCNSLTRVRWKNKGQQCKSGDEKTRNDQVVEVEKHLASDVELVDDVWVRLWAATRKEFSGIS